MLPRPFFRSPRLPVARAACAAALLVVGGAALAAGGDEREQESVRAAVAAGRYLPLASILESLERRSPGARALDVDTKLGVRGALLYEIKLVERNGTKRKVLLDAATGREIPPGEHPKQQALGMRELAAHLRRIEQHTGQRVAEAEFEMDTGQPAYQLWLAPSVESAQRVLMAASSGELLYSLTTGEGDSLRAMPDLLEALAASYAGLVLEVELEGVGGRSVYYEVDLRQDDGRKLTLHVDARSLQVLRSRLKND